MKRLLLFFAFVVLLFTGCANPTHVYHPLDMPARNGGEIVKYEGVEIQVKSTKVAYESQASDGMKLFEAEKFCYDPQNKYLVFPKDKVVSDYPVSSYYYIVPVDRVTLCKNGKVRDNSYFARNHMLHGAAIGAAILGGVGAVFGMGLGTMLALFSNGSFNFGQFWAYSIGIGAASGGVFGLAIDSGVNASDFIEDVKETCDAYFTDQELETYLDDNSCY